MCCEHFDPITASCAPCCWVCSYRGNICEKEKTVPVLEHRNSQAERDLNTLFFAYSLSKTMEEFKYGR